MKRKNGATFLGILTVFTSGMYVCNGINSSNWFPNGWLLTVIVALATIWVGYILGRSDYLPEKDESSPEDATNSKNDH